MKTKIFTINAAMLFLPYTGVFSQPSIQDINEAIDIIKGKSLSGSKEWAIDILQNCTDNNQHPRVSNALGMAYLYGIGIERDSTKSIGLFEDAAKAGYTIAFHNLGMIYKNAPYGRQDFSKSVFYFECGAERGSLICCYDAGYMYYKGIGCKQNYQKAVKYFEHGVESNNPSCLYMLALCYRNGFGVERNEEKAANYIKTSSLYNYDNAIEEASRDSAEVKVRKIHVEERHNSPQSMPEVEAFISRNSELSGLYKGIITTYDWSGQQIVREDELTINLYQKEKSCSGTWTQHGVVIPFKANIEENGALTFSDTRIILDDRYLAREKDVRIIEDASLTLLGTSLSGSVRMYSLTMKEPQRPMFISLERVFDDTPSSINDLSFTAIPLFGTGLLEVHINTTADISEASLTITTQQGISVKEYHIGELSPGKNKFIISPSIEEGVYIISLHAGSKFLHTVISTTR